MNVIIQAQNRWRQRDFLFVGLLAATVFAVAFVLGAGIIAATGIPATGGLGNIFAAVFLLVLGYQICPRPFMGTLTLALMFAIALPTTIGGPIGPFKIVNGIVIGLAFDLAAWIGRRSAASQVIGAAIASVLSLWGVYVGLVMLGLPGAERLQPLLLPLSGVQALLGAVGAWLALALFRKRLSKWPAVKRFQQSG